jgi:sugar lactone lactonase YvrE
MATSRYSSTYRFLSCLFAAAFSILYFQCGLDDRSDLTISTVAGDGAEGYSGDNGPAASARLDSPAGVAISGAGDVYIADTGNGAIRRVTPDGTITTVSGLSLFSPFGVAVDSSGNLFVSDYTAGSVYRKDTAGSVSTIADGLGGPRGIAVDSDGDVYIAEYSMQRVLRITPSGQISTVAGGGTADPGDGGQATAARLSSPAGVAVDSRGNLYIADRGDERVRKVSSNGVITTIAGTGQGGYTGDGGAGSSAQIYDPHGVAVDSQGNVYIALEMNGSIRMVNSAGIIYTIAGGWSHDLGDGGPAIDARLESPQGVAVDGQGTIFIADTYNHRIRMAR